MRLGGGVVFFFLLVAASATPSTQKQRDGESPAVEEPTEKDDPISFDFSTGYDAFSRDREKALRWKKLFERFGLADYHIFPTRETGPNLGPPLQIWGNGWGTSLWRDPVTGWPLQ